MKDFFQPLIFWYHSNNYNMPWRKTKSPYKIWISEIILQQTQVKTGKKYYIKWMRKFPTVKKLASSNIDKVLKAWEGLGYYQRAHNLHFTSKIINNKYNKKIPNTYDELVQLKGIGDYTASAILSIAYDKPYAAIDGNIKRVMSRLYMIDNKKEIISFSKLKIEKNMKYFSPSDINQSLMDLGREICKPKNPKCLICPIHNYCLAFKKNKISLFPPKKIPKKTPIFNVIVGIIWLDNKLLISKRKKDGLLGGLWELPGGKVEGNESSSKCLKREILEEINIKITINEKIGKIKHQYSHFGINLTAYDCQYKSGKIKALAAEKIKWINYKDINKYAFPKATLKIFEIINNQT